MVGEGGKTEKGTCVQLAWERVGGGRITEAAVFGRVDKGLKSQNPVLGQGRKLEFPASEQYEDNGGGSPSRHLTVRGWAGNERHSNLSGKGILGWISSEVGFRWCRGWSNETANSDKERFRVGLWKKSSWKRTINLKFSGQQCWCHLEKGSCRYRQRKQTKGFWSQILHCLGYTRTRCLCFSPIASSNKATA